MEEDLGRVGGGVGGGVGCGNRTLIETFLACIRVDLIRARMQSILASLMQESTRFIRDFDGGGEDEHWEVGQAGRVWRDGGCVKGGDGKVVEDGGGFLRLNAGGEGSGDAENGDGGDAKGSCVDGGEGECAFVGDTEGIVGVAEDDAYSTEKGGAGDTEGLMAV